MRNLSNCSFSYNYIVDELFINIQVSHNNDNIINRERTIRRVSRKFFSYNYFVFIHCKKNYLFNCCLSRREEFSKDKLSEYLYVRCTLIDATTTQEKKNNFFRTFTKGNRE